jgi:hypothetical protein
MGGFKRWISKLESLMSCPNCGHNPMLVHFLWTRENSPTKTPVVVEPRPECSRSPKSVILRVLYGE